MSHAKASSLGPALSSFLNLHFFLELLLQLALSCHHSEEFTFFKAWLVKLTTEVLCLVFTLACNRYYEDMSTGKLEVVFCCLFTKCWQLAYMYSIFSEGGKDAENNIHFSPFFLYRVEMKENGIVPQGSSSTP